MTEQHLATPLTVTISRADPCYIQDDEFEASRLKYLCGGCGFSCHGKQKGGARTTPEEIGKITKSIDSENETNIKMLEERR